MANAEAKPKVNAGAKPKVWRAIVWLILAPVFPFNVLFFLIRYVVSKVRKRDIQLTIEEVDQEDGTTRWEVHDENGNLPHQLMARIGDKIVWTLVSNRKIEADIAFPSILFKRSENETRTMKWFEDHHQKLIPGGRPIEKIISLLAPPGNYPYTVELIDEDGKSKFVQGGTDTRLHTDPW